MQRMVRAGLEPGISGSQGKRPNHWATLYEKFTVVWSRCRQTSRNNSQQHAITCSRVCKRTQHVTLNNAQCLGQGALNLVISLYFLAACGKEMYNYGAPRACKNACRACSTIISLFRPIIFLISSISGVVVS